MENPTPPAAVKKFGLFNVILILGLGVLLCGEAYFGYRLYALSKKQEQIKKDYSLSNSITFGIFSVDQWRDKLANVLNHQVTDYTITPAQKKALLIQVEQALNGLIDKTLAEFNKPQKSLMGKLKKLAVNTMVNADELHALVPSFSRTIINKVTSPSSVKRLKGVATSKLDQLEKQTYDSTDVANSQITKYLYNKYHVNNAGAYDKEITGQLAQIRQVTYNYAYAMLGCVAVALVLWVLMRKQVNLRSTLFIMSLLFAFVLLIVGVSASIIEVDARIQSLNFMLMGQKVSFDNQVLFFQTKSIIGIIRTLISQSKPDAVMVGSLILLFVIILPALRLVAKGIHVSATKRITEHKVVRYLTFELGKWDMADVMVIGILMTYIGLNGILKSQLSNLNIHSGSLTTVTENNSSLQPGYFIFIGYVVFATVLTYILKWMTPDIDHDAKKRRKWRKG